MKWGHPTNKMIGKRIRDKIGLQDCGVLPVRSIAGYCCCLRRQAKPRAVLLMPGRTMSRGHIAYPADMRSIAASGILNLRAHRCQCRSRQFVTVGMSESIPRNLCSGVRQRMERWQS
jgi:hypothetical protein